MPTAADPSLIAVVDDDGLFRDTMPVWNTAFYYEDAGANGLLAFVPLTPIYIGEPLGRYALSVWDWDPGQSGWDVLGAVT